MYNNKLHIYPKQAVNDNWPIHPDRVRWYLKMFIQGLYMQPPKIKDELFESIFEKL